MSNHRRTDLLRRLRKIVEESPNKTIRFAPFELADAGFTVRDMEFYLQPSSESIWLPRPDSLNRIDIGLTAYGEAELESSNVRFVTLYNGEHHGKIVAVREKTRYARMLRAQENTFADAARGGLEEIAEPIIDDYEILPVFAAQRIVRPSHDNKALEIDLIASIGVLSDKGLRAENERLRKELESLRARLREADERLSIKEARNAED